MMLISRYASPVGEITIAAENGEIAGLWIAGQKYYADKMTAPFTEDDADAAIVSVKRWLDAYFAGEKPETSSIRLSMRGSDFRKSVWEILKRIPYGETVTYGDIASEIAGLRGKSKMSAQAVGGAVGHNPVSIIVPCHRVVGADGNLTGYAGGIDIKVKLLAHEGADMSKFYVPAKGTAL